MKRQRLTRYSFLLLLLVGCNAKEKRIATDFNFDGSCVNCHAGLTAGKVHPTFKLRCVDCHGGNDQVEIPENAAADAAVYRDKDLLKQAHVRPKPGLARFFFANGIDDDDDGIVDEAPIFDGGGNVTNFGEIAELGLHGEGVGDFVDSEYNRDLNYVR